MRNLVSELRDTYDYIIIDSPPSLSLLTLNAMTAADSLLIPLQCEFYALEGIGNLLRTFRFLKRELNPDMGIAGILLTMFDRGEAVSKQIAEEARSHFEKLVFNTVIPRNVHLRESASYGKPLLLQNIMSIGALSYLRLARELMDRWSVVGGQD